MIRVCHDSCICMACACTYMAYIDVCTRIYVILFVYIYAACTYMHACMNTQPPDNMHTHICIYTYRCIFTCAYNYVS